MPDQMPEAKNSTPVGVENAEEILFAMDEEFRRQAKRAKDFTREEMREHRIDLAMAMMPRDSTITRAEIEEVIDSGRA